MSQPEVERSHTKGTWIDLAGILLAGALFLSPILISPHFGMFSDYGQILGWPERNVHSPQAFLQEFQPLADGRWTPMFHILTFALYALMGPSAFGFYLIQGLTLLASLAIVYLLTRWLAQGSRAAGWTACLLILVSAPLAEDYFTLDKVEPRLVFFSLVSLGYFAWRVASARQRHLVSGLEWSMVFGAHFVAAVLIIFSKETGTFMVGVAFLALAATWLQKDRDVRLVKEAALFFAAMVVALVLYVWLSSALLPEQARALRAQNAGVGRYLNYGVTPALVIENTSGYWTWMKDTAACVVIFVAWCAGGLWQRRRRDWDDRHMLLFLAGSGGCLYLAGMLLWRWMLLYYMLPAIVFLAVAVGAIAFDVRTTKVSRIGWPIAILLSLVLALAFHVSDRWRTAWIILAQDRSKDAILRAMERQAGSHSKFVVAMFDVRSAEIGQSMERYLALDGYKGKTFVYNLVEGP
jgi:4-amino-4-deoxy-L-arabinose transferase-like glycosyltransferase